MLLKDTLRQSMTQAMKSGNKERTSVLRMLLSEITYAETAPQIVEPEKAIQRYHKKLIEVKASLNSSDERATTVDREIAIVEEYLPKQTSREDLQGFIQTLDTKQPFGFLMKAIKAQYPNSDGRLASELVKQAQSV